MATNPETRAGSRGLKAAAGALFFLGTVALAGVVLQVTQSSDDELLAQAKDAEFLSFGPRGPAPHQTGQDPRTPGPDLAVDAASPGSAAGGTPEAVAVADRGGRGRGRLGRRCWRRRQPGSSRIFGSW
jgi:hypothetical protein